MSDGQLQSMFCLGNYRATRHVRYSLVAPVSADGPTLAGDSLNAVENLTLVDALMVVFCSLSSTGLPPTCPSTVVSSAGYCDALLYALPMTSEVESLPATRVWSALE